MVRSSRSTSRRCRRQSIETPERTTAIRRNGFLDHRFMPLIEDKHGILKNKKAIETDFFQSIMNLANLYGLSIPNTKAYPFPFNIQIAYKSAKEQLRAIAPKLELIIINQGKQVASVTTVQCFYTGIRLYYIPIRPLVDLLQDPNRQPEAEQLLYVFTYLYHVAAIPWFLDNSSFLDYTYDCLESWYAEESEPGEEEATLQKLAVFQRMRKESVIIQQNYGTKEVGWMVQKFAAV